MRSHSFSVDVAQKYGIDIALMLNHFSFWYLKNKSDGVNFHENDFWVRMRAEQLREYFPYYSLRQLRYIIDKMIDLELLKQDTFNKRSNDTTKWYCLSKLGKKIMQISVDKSNNKSQKTASKNTENWSDKNVTPLSDKNVSPSDKNVTSIIRDTEYRYYNYITEKLSVNISLLEVICMQNKLKIETVKNKIDEFQLWCSAKKQNHFNDGDLYTHFSAWIRNQNLKDVDLEKEVTWFIQKFNEVARSEYLVTDTIKKRFAEQFANGFTGRQMVTAVQNMYSSSPANKFHIDSQFKFATPEYILKDDNINKYLNFKV